MKPSLARQQGACSDCGSSDACALYDDGHTFCFSCGTYHPPERIAQWETRPGAARRAGLIRGELEPLRKRKLDLKTVEKFGYRVGTYHGKPVQIAPYHDAAGRVVAQKLRDPGQEHDLEGQPQGALPLFGQAPLARRRQDGRGHRG
jgi:twinkle protein